MDSFELNKVLGALLGTVFILFSVNLVADAIFAAPAPEKPGYVIQAAEGGETQAPAEEKAVPIATLLQNADADKGQGIFKRCQACHNGEKGGPNKVGPNLWGVVGRPVASHEGFSYSAAMKDFSNGGTEHWTYENLNHFLTDPKAFVPGTAMSFAGLKKDSDRADVIAFLRTLADNPEPLPEPPADNAAGDSVGAAPADSGAPRLRTRTTRLPQTAAQRPPPTAARPPPPTVVLPRLPTAVQRLPRAVVLPRPQTTVLRHLPAMAPPRRPTARRPLPPTRASSCLPTVPATLPATEARQRLTEL